MASSLYFPGKYFFYPIGNTSAVCLTRDVPPELPASILLLPCGDPRNVLYTVFCEESNRLGRSLDFTCCDFDPGVLARNVLLLTMLMDGVAADSRWNIFFHMYLDSDSRSMLVSQSQKLASYPSAEAWRSSPYGTIIKMGTEHTFAELRRHWQLCVLVVAPPSAISVALAVRSDPITARVLTPILGLTLCVFQASLQDTEHVHLLPEQPLRQPGSGVATPQQPEWQGLEVIGHQQPVRVDLDSAGKRVASLTVKLDITNTTAKAAFASDAMPNISQCSPCTMQVVLSGQKQTLAYPMPIVGGQRKVRLARKSSYIEVIVPVAIPFTELDGFRLNPFPVICTNTSLSPWNVHRVFLDRLPVLNLSKSNIPQLQEWYNPHVGSQLSVRERNSIRDPARLDLLANIKETIHCIMVRSAGTQGSKESMRAFALRDGPTQDCDTIIFVDKVRFDLSAHAMVCDAFVLPLSNAIMPRIEQAFKQLLGHGLENVNLYGLEMRRWKRLLPALVERCRATWTHGANCEYAAHGRIPLELEISEGDPLCSCGRGKDTEGMMKDRVWRRFAPFVTRIALSPLFAVSYLEPIFEAGMFEEDGRSLVSDSPRGSIGTAPVAMCGKCQKRESATVKMRMCSRCRTTFYCSEACQRGDWKTHKLQCKK